VAKSDYSNLCRLDCCHAPCVSRCVLRARSVCRCWVQSQRESNRGRDNAEAETRQTKMIKRTKCARHCVLEKKSYGFVMHLFLRVSRTLSHSVFLSFLLFLPLSLLQEAFQLPEYWIKFYLCSPLPFKGRPFSSLPPSLPPSSFPAPS